MAEIQTIDYEKILANETDDDTKITFTPLELKYFALELKDMIAAGEFDIPKAIRNARFYAEIAQRTENIKAGHWTEHGLIETDELRSTPAVGLAAGMIPAGMILGCVAVALGKTSPNAQRRRENLAKSKRWDDKAWEDYVAWQTEDKKTLERINDLIKDIERSGAAKGIGKPKRLKYETGYSRRIDEKNRLVYEIDEHGYLYIKSCKGHYE